MRKAIFINMILLLTLTLSSCIPEAVPSNNGEIKKGQLTVHFIDVGQADCILIETDSYAMLIDAGNKSDGNAVIKYIEQLGIDRLDYVIATHPHEDHIGGMAEVLQAFKTDRVYLPQVTHTTAAFGNMIAAIKKQGLKATAPIAGSSFALGEATCMILAPNRSSYDELNNYSIVIKMVYGETSFLFTGDAEIVSEKEMLEKNYDLTADVLKIGHHGSYSSTGDAFLGAVDPTYAIISLGKNNSYGFPHRETMEKLKKHNVVVYRTDESGTVVAVSDGKTITFNDKPEGNANNQEEEPSIPGDDAITMEDYYIGNEKKKTFHRPTCSGLPALQNQAVLETRDEAINQGYIPCGRCNP